MKQTFKLSGEQKQKMIGMIQDYFENEVKEPMGNLSAMLLLEFIIENLAPQFYNMGVEDSHTYLTEKLDDLFEIQKY